MMIHNMKIHWLFALPALLFAVGCSENTLPEEGPENERTELQIVPQVALTRAAISASTEASEVGTALGSIAVYASNDVTNKATNNYGLYTYDDNTGGGGSVGWKNTDTSNKIYLSAEEANIYAYYPAYQPGTGGALTTETGSATALKVNSGSMTDGKVTANSTVNITVFPGTSSSSDDNQKITIPSTTTASEGVTPPTYTAPGEVDYLYADQTSTPKASYKKDTSGKDGTVSLNMKHALAMVSFRVYADHTYQNTGAFTKLQLGNENSGTVVNDGGTNPTMNISSGTITAGTSPVAVTYIRNIEGYSLPKATSSTDDGTTAKGTAAQVGILVLPESATDKSTVKVTLTIDNQDYVVKLGSSGNAWTAGNNYLYTVKLSGSELSITSVTVTAWAPQTGGDLNIQ